MKPTDFDLAMRRTDFAKLGAQMGFTRAQTSFFMAAEAAYNGQSPSHLLHGLTKRELHKIARGAVLLRDTAFQLGGTKRLSADHKKTPRTGQNKAVEKWLMSKNFGFEFTSLDVAKDLTAYTRQQIHNALWVMGKKGFVKIIKAKRGTTPARLAVRI